MAKPVVIVVGADKGGVGKTTVSRTLLDYFSANNVQTRAFDTESPRGTLKRFHPDITEIVDMTTTAEGVETEQQRNMLRILGCTEMQGYLFSRPVPDVEIRRLLSAHREKAVSVA